MVRLVCWDEWMTLGGPRVDGIQSKVLFRFAQ